MDGNLIFRVICFFFLQCGVDVNGQSISYYEEYLDSIANVDTLIERVEIEKSKFDLCPCSNAEVEAKEWYDMKHYGASILTQWRYNIPKAREILWQELNPTESDSLMTGICQIKLNRHRTLDLEFKNGMVIKMVEVRFDKIKETMNYDLVHRTQMPLLWASDCDLPNCTDLRTGLVGLSQNVHTQNIWLRPIDLTDVTLWLQENTRKD